MVSSPKNDEHLAELYHWVDAIPLSRPKKNISRDFSDGVLMAEVVSFCTPKLIDVHNYSAANSLDKKVYNWNTLNQKVFQRLGIRLKPEDIDDVVNGRPGAIEKIITLFRRHAEEYKARVAEQASLLRDASADLLRKQRVEHDTGGPVGIIERNFSASAMLREKEDTICELQEMNIIMREKVKHLEQLIRLKDERINMLIQELTRAGTS